MTQTQNDLDNLHLSYHPKLLHDCSLQLFKAVVTRYLKRVLKSFCKSIGETSSYKKTEAYRKKVVEKKNKKDLTSSKVTL